MTGFVLIVIQHLLTDFLAFGHALIELGVDPADVFLIGIPYSSKKRTVLGLKSMGFKNVRAPTEYPFEDDVKTVIDAALQRCELTGKKLLVIEDGGYVVPLFHGSYAGSVEVVHGAVEQTANGIWADKELDKSGLLRFPVINVAESAIKDRRESPLIGQAVVDNIRRLLGTRGRDVAGKKAIVLGYGSIGRQVVRALGAAGARSVAVSEVREDRRAQAATDGVSDIFEMPIGEPLSNYSIVVGCTGRQREAAPLDAAALLWLQHTAVVASATSKRSEINYADLASLTVREEHQPGYGRIITMRNEFSFALLANGFPVNFFDTSESVPDTMIQFIPAIMLAGAAYLAQRSLPAGIHDVPSKLQDQIDRIQSAAEGR